MANNNETIFQRLNKVFTGSKSIPNEYIQQPTENPNQFPMGIIDDKVLFKTNDKDEYERKLNQMRQQKLLSYQWIKAGADNAMENMAGYTAVKLMYRDSDLMDGTPEIGSALDTYAEEACTINTKGKMLNIYSKSNRVKSILEDLFVNRLNCHVMLPMFCREMCKYGNAFALLNIDDKDGVRGWMKLPVYEIDRVESGTMSGYGNGNVVNDPNNMRPDEVKFVWTGHNEGTPYTKWQVAHFRMLNDAFFLPYGVSVLHKARRAWRMWSMMEDAMLIYRLDKSIERRVFKIFVGAIDEQDVPAYIQQVANNFKRTPIIDPATGQVDLRKNYLDVSTDYFIPVRSESSPNPIETLNGAQNQTSMEDIGYMQNKVFSALRVPKTFLNFQEAQGKGQNLALMDIRFARLINRIQQFLLMELNKIAMTHLYLIGMTDDITNFTLSLNNPSTQIEQQELDEMTKRLGIVSTVLADPGIGMPIFSLHKALKDIMKMSDKEIKEMLNEIRIEKAMAGELANTPNIIKKTGMFDPVDRIYGDFEAMDAAQGGGAGAEAGGGGGAPGGAPDAGMGEEGGDMSGGDMMPLGGAALGADSGAGGGAPAGGDTGGGDAGGGAGLMESKKVKSFTQLYFEMLDRKEKEENGETEEVFDFDKKNNMINEDVNKIMNKIDNMIKPSTEEMIEEEITSDDDII